MCCSHVLASGDLHDIPEMTIRGIYESPITLHEGYYEGSPFATGGASRPTVSLLKSINADSNTRLLLLTENSGGSGTTTYLAIVRQKDGESDNVATVALGDRERLRAMTMSNGQIIFHLITTGPDDPRCCPTLKQRRVYNYDGSTLVIAEQEDQGPVGIEDLTGKTWRLTHLSHIDSVPPGVSVTAEFSAVQISGSSGCNRYFAGIEVVEGSQLHIRTPAGTRMMCPPPAIDIEVRYLNALQHVQRFDFDAGDLLLLYTYGDSMEALRFVGD